jgi:hypothetical protein
MAEQPSKQKESTDVSSSPSSQPSEEATKLPWALERVRRMCAAAYVDAAVYGKKLLKGFGYPNEAFSRAQDALALGAVLDERQALLDAMPDAHKHLSPLESMRILARLFDDIGTSHVLLSRRASARGMDLPERISFVLEQLEAFKQDARDKGRQLRALSDWTEATMVIFRNYYAQAITRDKVDERLAEWVAYRRLTDALASPAVPVPSDSPAVTKPDEIPDLLEMSHALRGLGDALAFDAATAPEAMRLEVLRIARETVEWAVAQLQPLHSMQEAVMWKWANEQLAIAKTPQVTNERPISAEEWPCTFSHHTHATREEAVECARPRREGPAPLPATTPGEAPAEPKDV